MMLTLDIDNASQRVAHNKARLLAILFRKEVYVRRSASGKGYHIKLHGLPARNYAFIELLLLRYWLGDDPRRVRMDLVRSQKGICTQVLFSCKGDRYAGPWEVVECR